jgi:uncharacterized protein (TIGR02145 family)
MTKTKRLCITITVLGAMAMLFSNCKKDEPLWKANTVINSDGKTGTVIDVEGNTYAIKKIGNQWWMAENLKTRKDADGNDIERYCYDNDTTKCELYGGLYTWHTVMNGASSSDKNPSGVQGICPTGWHVPSNAEWIQLVDFLVAQGFPNEEDDPNGAGNALKSCRQVNSPLGGDCNTTEHPRWKEDTVSGYNQHGFDKFGFSGFAGGRGSLLYDDFSYLGDYGYWWSSTEIYRWEYAARYHYLRHDNGRVNDGLSLKESGFSVRCLRNK